FLGLAGMPRRIPDYNVAFADWNFVSSIGAFGMFVTPLMMFAIFYAAKKSGAKATSRVWEGAHGLEWEVPSPAPYHTYSEPPVIGPGMLAHGDVTH
ncbi:MAG: cytochrome c oxidase subunit I, partial [Gammaproteobacteria bacterium]